MTATHDWCVCNRIMTLHMTLGREEGSTGTSVPTHLRVGQRGKNANALNNFVVIAMFLMIHRDWTLPRKRF